MMARSGDLPISAAGSAVIRGGSLALSFGGNVLLARTLGPSEFGTYASALAVFGLLLLPSTLGIPIGLVQVMSRYVATRQTELARGVARWGSLTVASLSVAVAIVSVAVLLSRHLDPHVSLTYVLAFAALPFAAITLVQQGIMQSFQRVIVAQLPEAIARPALLLGAVGAIAIVAPVSLRARSDVAAAAQLCAYTTACLLAVLLARTLQPAGTEGPRRYEIARWYRTSFGMAGIAAAQLILAQIDVVMLSWLADSTSVGLYRIAIASTAFVAFPLLAVDSLLMPRIAASYLQSDRAPLQKMLTDAARLAAGASLPVLLLFVIAGQPLLNFLYGSSFSDAYPYMAVLALAQAINVATGMKISVLQMTGNQSQAATAIVIAALADIVLNAVLIPTLGALGASLATSASTVLMNILLVRGIVRRVGVDPTVIGGRLRS